MNMNMSAGSSSPFYKCPPELCSIIFALACLDDGTTGRSLSLVSKYISDTSKPYKLQSLAVRSLYHAEGLATILRKLSYSERRIVNLFVVCDYPRMYTNVVANVNVNNAGQEQSAWLQVHQRLSLGRGQHPYHIYPIIEELYTLAIVRILTLVSPTLRSLSISVSTCGLWVGLPGVPNLPLLEELTLAYKSERLTTRLLHSFRQLPALRYLDLTQYSDCGCSPRSLVAKIEHLAPSLTTLRVPYILSHGPKSLSNYEQPRVHNGWMGWLKKIEDKDMTLDGRESSRARDPETRKRKPRLSRTVQCIIIVLPDEGEHGNNEIVEESRQIARVDKRVVCVIPKHVTGDVVGDRLERGWLERVNDGGRYWKTEKPNDSEIKGRDRPYAYSSFAAAPTIMQTVFPPELVDAVIDQIHQDVRINDGGEQYLASERCRRITLDACSLVSKSWLPRSRYHIFESVRLRRRSFMRILAFLTLLHTPLSTIAPYVRQLHLEEDSGQTKNEVRWVNAVLPQLTVLSALKSLYVCWARFDVLETEDMINFLNSFQQLKKLDLHQCKFATYTQLVGALSASRGLEDVRLDRVQIQPMWGNNDVFDTVRLDAMRYPREAIDPSVYGSPPSRLHTLDFSHGFQIREFFKWLVQDSPIPPIHTLRLCINQTEDLQPVADLLKVLGPSVKNLAVNDSSASKDCYGVFSRYVDLSYNTQLRSIDFTQIRSSVASIPIAPVLAQITTPNIREVIIRGIFVHDENGTHTLDGLDWSKIEHILEQPNYSGLQKLAFYGWRPEFFEGTRKLVNKKLPRCSERGIIQIS